MTEAAISAAFQGIHCRIEVLRPAPRVIVLVITGKDGGELGAAPFRELERDLGDLELFIDARGTRGAGIDTSSRWARWLARNRSSFRAISMLSGSRFVQLTAEFVRRFAELGDLMRVYTDAAAFDVALAQAAGRSAPDDGIARRGS